MNTLIINNQALTFPDFSLSGKVARKLINALNTAYMHSLSITCAPYAPTVQDDRHRYMTACQMVHDNVYDATECQSVRNECLEKLRA